MQYGSLPVGSSELVYLEKDGFSWSVGFAGIPRIGVLLSVLSAMENNIRPNLPDGCVFTVIFFWQEHDELIMTSVTPEFVPNANTYADCLHFVSRTQHLCFE